MDEPRAEQSANSAVAMACVWVLNSSDALLPRDSWPWLLLRETAFTLGGQGRYAQAELDQLLKSGETGPVGCLATAYLLGKTNPKLARTFAERGLARLTAAEFRQDYRALFHSNSILGEMAGHTLGVLGSVSEAQWTPLLASFAPDHTAFLRQLTLFLRERKGQPSSDAAWPAFEQHWDKTLRGYVAMGLNRFLPQVQFLTNSRALYERGLVLVAPDSAFQDFDEAAQCFRKAADRGHAGAQVGLGQLYERGQGVHQDLPEAMNWYRKAAEQKEPHATCRIGDLYREGKGTRQDLDEAAKWYRVEAEGNCPKSQFELGHILETKLNTDEALKWYRRAAEGGTTPAQAKLGELLSEGLFTPADLAEAAQWLSLAAAAGDKFSEISLRRVKAKLTAQQWAEAERRAAAVEQRRERTREEQDRNAAGPRK